MRVMEKAFDFHEVLTLKEAAERLSLPPMTLYRMWGGVIPAVRLRERWRFIKADGDKEVKTWIKK